MRSYSLLDFGLIGGSGRRLEQWGAHRLSRPDARATGTPTLDSTNWQAADAAFDGRVGGGRWQFAAGHGALPDRWEIAHAGLTFLAGCAPSGHTGLFPEQAAHWGWMTDALAALPRPEPALVLNLFAYTGGASIALAVAGARVTHVDSSRPAVGWARDNAARNGVSTVRWIQEDARRFVDREHRRGTRYDALLLDPPAYGRGPAGDWQLDRDLDGLLEAAVGLLAPAPAFVLLNAYTGSRDAGDLERLLSWALDARPDRFGLGPIEAEALSLTAEDSRTLPTGVYARAACAGVAPRG